MDSNHHHKKAHHHVNHKHEHGHGFDPADLDEAEVYQRRLSPWFKYIAILVIIALAAFFLPNLASLIPGSYSFLHQDQALLQDPQVKTWLPAVVSIEAVGDDGLLIQDKNGTGFNVRADGLILTNFHVISGSRAIHVTFMDNRTFITDQWRQIAGLDIAVIDIPGQDLPSIQLDLSTPVQSSQVVTVIGNPLGLQRFTQRGPITRLYRDGNSNMNVFEIGIAARPGLSGSPVINESGRVYGIVFAAKGGKYSNTLIKNHALAIPFFSYKTAIQSALREF